MGMAASQARWLALTARKTNVEYEGQQVNQARTALAMKSANTFNELLALEVPTAPSTQDFTTLEYTYQDGTITETVDTMSQLNNDPDGYNYMIKHYHYADVFTGIENRLTNPQVVMGTAGTTSVVKRSDIKKTSENEYTIQGSTATVYDPTVKAQYDALQKILENYPDIAKSTDILYTYMGSDGSRHFISQSSLEGTGDVVSYYVAKNIPEYVGNCTVTRLNPTDVNQKASYEQICRDWPTSSFAKSGAGNIYTWEFQGERRYACLEDLVKTSQSGPDQATPSENQDKLLYYVAKDVNTRIENEQKAIVDINEQGRIQSIRYEDSSAVYAVSTNTKTDTNAYEDAMNQYHYDMEVYEKRIQDINAKTEKIQEQDRTLELRLRQLDTEQEALQTEMEAVQKVIQKNIESTFKTFES